MESHNKTRHRRNPDARAVAGAGRGPESRGVAGAGRGPKPRAEHQPLVGLVPLVDDERESYWMLPGYMRGVQAAGGLPVMLPLTCDDASIAQLAETCDAFLLTGGHDVAPSLYGEAPGPHCGASCAERDAMEAALIDAALAAGKPLLGICRGIQLLNAHLGGTLYQDLPSEKPSDLQHHQTPPYDRPVHSVRIVPGTPLADALEEAGLPARELAVNSYHHQGVRTLAPALRPMAEATDGLVEAVWIPEARFAWAVQWHPEFSFRADPASRAVFRAFVDAARG